MVCKSYRFYNHLERLADQRQARDGPT